MITDKEFITKENEEEISSVIESFLNRWKREKIYSIMDKDKTLSYLEVEEKVYEVLPTDKEKYKIIKQMIKDFEGYKN